MRKSFQLLQILAFDDSIGSNNTTSPYENGYIQSLNQAPLIGYTFKKEKGKTKFHRI